EPPAARERAADPVPRGVAAAVEVEPQAALQLEAVGARLGVAAAALGEPQAAALLDHVRGQVAPLARQIGLLRIDRGHALDLRDAQFRPRLEDPGLLRIPGVARLGIDELGIALRMAGAEGERVRAGADLHAQRAVELEAR